MATVQSLRLPSHYTPGQDLRTNEPPVSWLYGRWYIAYSTLKMWQGKCRCTVDYSELPPTASGLTRIDDMVHYEVLGSPSSEKHQIHAVNTQWPNNPAGWTWRGLGWLLGMIRCDWEIFGFGRLEGGGEWMMMYFRKGWFNSEGLDLFVRGGKVEIDRPAYEAIIRSVKDIAVSQEDLLRLLDQFERVPV